MLNKYAVYIYIVGSLSRKLWIVYISIVGK